MRCIWPSVCCAIRARRDPLTTVRSGAPGTSNIPAQSKIAWRGFPGEERITTWRTFRATTFAAKRGSARGSQAHVSKRRLLLNRPTRRSGRVVPKTKRKRVACETRSRIPGAGSLTASAVQRRSVHQEIDEKRRKANARGVRSAGAL